MKSPCDGDPNYAEFAYYVAHELGAPIRQIEGFLAILLEDIDSLNDDQKQSHAMIMKAIVNAKDILGGIGRLAQFNDKVIKKSKFELESLLSGVFENNRPFVTLGDYPKVIYGGESLVALLIGEVVDNAIKFQSPDRELKIDIAGECDPKNETTRLFISDNGIGIEPDYIERAFKPLQQLHPKNSYAGCGVGLNICRKIMAMHGGYIDIIPKSNDGITVELGFPNS
jgi:light-regulated signal transduction histidine kinase (bacteriophytochrome)